MITPSSVTTHPTGSDTTTEASNNDTKDATTSVEPQATLLDQLPTELIRHIISFLLTDYISITTQQPYWWKQYFHSDDNQIKIDTFGCVNSEIILTLLNLSSTSFQQLNSIIRVDLNKYWHQMFNACFKVSSLLATKVTPSTADMEYGGGDWEESLQDANIFARYYVAKEIGYLGYLDDTYTESLPIEMLELGEQSDVDQYMKQQMELLDRDYDENEDYFIRFILEQFRILKNLNVSAYFTSTVMAETLTDHEISSSLSSKPLEVFCSCTLTFDNFYKDWNSKWFNRIEMNNFLFAKVQVGTSKSELFGSESILFPDSIIDVSIEQSGQLVPTLVFPSVRHLTLRSYNTNFWDLIHPIDIKFPKLKSLALIVPIQSNLATIGSFPQFDDIRLEYNYSDYIEEEKDNFLHLQPKYSLSYHYYIHPKRELYKIPNLYNYGLEQNIRVSLNDAAMNTFYSLSYE